MRLSPSNMKYSARFYAKALVDALADPKADHDAIAKRFLGVIKRNGDEGQLKKILDEASWLARQGEGVSREVVIESARPLKESQKKMLKVFLKPHDIIHEKIDPALVAGVKITVNDEMQFDGTMKAKLDSLFQA
jgi:F0F1-type ATP synthase delta subunit